MAPLYGLQRSLWDGIEMSFATQLDAPSQAVLHGLMVQHLLRGDASMLKVRRQHSHAAWMLFVSVNTSVKHALMRTLVTTQGLLRAPPAPPGNTHVLFDHFWVRKGPLTVDQGNDDSFVVTPSIAGHLRNLARAVQLHRHPVLLQVGQARRLCDRQCHSTVARDLPRDLYTLLQHHSSGPNEQRQDKLGGAPCTLHRP